MTNLRLGFQKTLHLSLCLLISELLLDLEESLYAPIQKHETGCTSVTSVACRHIFKSESCPLEGRGRGEGTMCLVDTGSSADCCLTLSSAVWLLIGPEASTSRRPSDQLQMWNERGQF